MLSELVTNAIRHAPAQASATVGLYLAVAPECIRAEICDSGGGFAAGRVSVPNADELGGRGLLLVDHLATRWGAGADDRHSVWFELDRLNVARRPDYTTERYLRDLRDAARVKRTAPLPLPQPTRPVEPVRSPDHRRARPTAVCIPRREKGVRGEARNCP
jgi:hypothetical protein